MDKGDDGDSRKLFVDILFDLSNIVVYTMTLVERFFILQTLTHARCVHQAVFSKGAIPALGSGFNEAKCCLIYERGKRKKSEKKGSISVAILPFFFCTMARSQ
jgi:hypothetical protein